MSCCACGSRERDDFDLIIEQQFHRHSLLHIARHDSVDGFARTGDGNQVTGVCEHATETRVALVILVDEQQELIRERFDLEAMHTIRRGSLESFEARDEQLTLIVELVDEIARHTHGEITRVQEVCGNVICFEIFRWNAERIALYPCGDVLRDEDRALACSVERCRDGENSVVVDREIKREGWRLDAVTSIDANGTTLIVPLHANEEWTLLTQTIERANGLSRVTSCFVVVFLECVEFFDHREWNHHFMLSKLEHRIGVVKQHVRVEHEMLSQRLLLNFCA